MRRWIWLACAACGSAAPSRGIESAGGEPGSLAITSSAELVAPGIVSSPYTEIRLAASPDGRMLLSGTFPPGQPRSRKIFQRDTGGRITGFADRREARDVVWTRLP